MAKAKTASVFYCQNCGYESTKWMGQCPGCREWNTFVEETVSPAERKNAGGPLKRMADRAEVNVLSEITIREENRLLTGIGELDRVLGGGIGQGSLTLVEAAWVIMRLRRIMGSATPEIVIPCV